MNKKLYVVCLGLGLSPATAFAVPTVYTYTGAQFSNVPDSGAIPGQYDTGMRITGAITLDGAITPSTTVSFSDVSPNLIAFNFNDGRFNYTPNNVDAAVSLVTNASGGISAWSIFMQGSIPAANVGSFQVDSGTPCSTFCDRVVLTNLLNTAQDRAESLNLGSWTVTPVPEPSTYAFMLAGIALVGFAAHRRKLQK